MTISNHVTQQEIFDLYLLTGGHNSDADKLSTIGRLVELKERGLVYYEEEVGFYRPTADQKQPIDVSAWLEYSGNRAELITEVDRGRVEQFNSMLQAEQEAALISDEKFMIENFRDHPSLKYEPVERIYLFEGRLVLADYAQLLHISPTGLDTDNLGDPYESIVRLSYRDCFEPADAEPMYMLIDYREAVLLLQLCQKHDFDLPVSKDLAANKMFTDSLARLAERK